MLSLDLLYSFLVLRVDVERMAPSSILGPAFDGLQIQCLPANVYNSQSSTQFVLRDFLLGRRGNGGHLSLELLDFDVVVRLNLADDTCNADEWIYIVSRGCVALAVACASFWTIGQNLVATVEEVV